MGYNFDDSFGFMISKVKNKLKTEMSLKLKPYGITPEQRSILLLLCKNGAMTQRALCDMTASEPSNMTATLKRLQKSGYVEKSDHPADSRAYLVDATEKARTIQFKLISFGSEITDSLLVGISEEEQTVTLKTLKKMFDNI